MNDGAPLLCLGQLVILSQSSHFMVLLIPLLCCQKVLTVPLVEHINMPRNLQPSCTSHHQTLDLFISFWLRVAGGFSLRYLFSV
jgi:hypothetical protein